MIFEFLYLLAILAFGVLLLSRFGLKGWPLVPLGFLTSLGIYIASVHIQIGLGINSNPVIAISVMLGVSLYLLWTNKLKYRELDSRLVMNSVVVLAALFVLVGVFWNANLAKYHYDPFRYLIVSDLIADDELDHISSNLNAKRLSAVSVMHAPANLYDEEYIHSITPIVSICLLASLAWSLKELSGKSRQSNSLKLGVVLALLLLVSNRSYIWHSFYLNGHLLFGAFALLAIGSGLLLARRKPAKTDQKALLIIQCVSLISLVLSRQEGALLAFLFIVPTTLYSLRLKDKLSLPTALPLLALGGAVFLKELTLIQSVWQVYNRFILPDKRFLLLATMFTLVPLALYYKKIYGFVSQHARLLLTLSEAGLWALLGLFALVQTEIVADSLSATWENLVLGKGAWGLSVILLAIVVVAAIILNRNTKNELLQYLRYPVTAFLPLALMLANLRGIAYRVGAPDSLNRMWMQIIPLAVLYIMVTLVIFKFQASRTHD